MGEHNGKIGFVNCNDATMFKNYKYYQIANKNGQYESKWIRPVTLSRKKSDNLTKSGTSPAKNPSKDTGKSRWYITNYPEFCQANFHNVGKESANWEPKWKLHSLSDDVEEAYQKYSQGFEDKSYALSRSTWGMDKVFTAEESDTTFGIALQFSVSTKKLDNLFVAENRFFNITEEERTKTDLWKGIHETARNDENLNVAIQLDSPGMR